jgi:hypothetical protein
MHTHTFVETYNGLVGFGLNRETDEATVTVFLQKFSDDRLMERIIPRMTDHELSNVFTLVSQLLKHHLTEEEYHALFLGQAHEDKEKQI